MNFRELVKIALAAGLIAIGVHQFANAADTTASVPTTAAISPR